MAELKQSLAYSVRHNPRFQSAYAELQKESLASVLGRVPCIDFASAKRLSQSAVIFSASNLHEDVELAQDIAWALVEITGNTFIRATCLHVLNTVGNFPGVSFLRKNDAEIDKVIPWVLQLQELVRESGNTVALLGKSLTFTDFQLQVWQQLFSNKKALAVRAPTSAGKTFVLNAYLRNRFAQTRNSLVVAYIVPSRALLHEVHEKLSREFAEYKIKAIINSIPVAKDHLRGFERVVHVFTQERLQALLNFSVKNFVHEIIVDEAQQIADDARGLILQQCLEEVLRRNSLTKVVLLTPGRQDASGIGRQIGLEMIERVETTNRPVRQNLIYVDFDENHTKDLYVSLYRKNASPLNVGQVMTDWDFSKEKNRLVGSALVLGANGQSLVYAPSKSPAEQIASELAKRQEKCADDNGALKALTDFVRKHIHPKYPLVETIPYGVGYHYGNMPTALTKALEEYFDEGKLKYLVCTSTLLHGVNLPARNIFLYRPTRGPDTPIDTDGFWNLAGRAGRMSRDVQGNVFLIDYKKWDSKPLEDADLQKVEPALKKAITTDLEQLISYAMQVVKGREGVENDFMEAAFTRLCVDYLDGKLLSTISKNTEPSELDEQKLRTLTKIIGDAMSEVELPFGIIKKSPLISPLRQQVLYKFFKKKIQDESYSQLIPLHPLNGSFGLVRDSLIPMFNCIEKYLKNSPSNIAKYYSGLALLWMRGNFFRVIVDSEAKFKIDNGGQSSASLNYPSIIRKLMDNIERNLRFKYVKYTACYIEILRYAFIENKIYKSSKIANIPLFLELGASSDTMISCLELGMSRFAAKELADAMKKGRLKPQQVKKWLIENSLGENVSPLVLRELKRIGIQYRAV